MQTATLQAETLATTTTTTTLSQPATSKQTKSSPTSSSSRGSFREQEPAASEPVQQEQLAAQLYDKTSEKLASSSSSSSLSSFETNTETHSELTETKVTSNEVMEILQSNQAALQDKLLISTTTTTTTPKIYPNNTLLVDLSKCHRNITNFWPQSTQAALVDTLKGCWKWHQTRQVSSSSMAPKSTKKKAKLNFQMPESILRTNVMLTLDDYDKALSMLTNDIRYQLHLLLYRRIHTIWVLITTLLCSILPILLTNLDLIIVIASSCLWLILQLLGSFVSTKFREKLDQMLEKSVAQANTFFMDHNLMLGVINTGSFLSKSKLIIPMLYFDTSQCREQIESIMSIDSRKDADGNNNNNSTLTILDYSKIGLPLKKPNIMAFAQSQLAKKTVLRYSQRWISYFDKQKLMFNDDKIKPRHLSTGKCLCQFIEEHFGNFQDSTLKAELVREQQEVIANHHQLSINCNNSEPISNLDSCILNKIEEATLIPNGKHHTQYQYHPREEPQVTCKNLPQAIDKTTAIPTLSGLISSKDSNHLTIHIPQPTKGLAQTLDNSQQTNGFTKHNESTWRQLVLYPDEKQQNFNHQTYEQSQKTNLSQASVNQTPNSTSPEVSLEMDCDLISRSDELVKKLRLLLEIKKDELQGIDGSLFSSVLYRAAPQPPIKPITTESGGDNLYINDATPVVIVNEVAAGKRFYTQREGLFFLGSSGLKKSHHQQQQQQQQPQDTTRNHVLEIC